MPPTPTRRDVLKLGAVTAAGLLAGCGDPTALGEEAERISGGGGAPTRGGVLRYGLSTDPSNFLPHVSTGAASGAVKQLAYNTLLRYDDDGEIVGDLATEFGYADPLTFELTLAGDVTFHNGQPLTADDVVFSIRQILDPETAATDASLYEGVEEVEAVAPDKVLLRLREPNVVLPYALASPNSNIVSRAWTEGGNDAQTEMMGTGPFRLVERVPGVSITLERFEGYFVPDLARLNAVQFLPMPDDYARVAALRSATVDAIDYVPATHIDVVRNADGITFNSDRTFGFGFIGFVNDRDPVADLKVRQAFAHALDRESMVDTAFLGHGEPMTGGLLPKEVLGHDPELAGRYAHDPERARRLLREAGLSRLDVELLTTSTYSVIFRPAEAALPSLREVGVEARLNRQEWLTFRESVKAKTFPVHVWGTAITYGDPDCLREFVGSSGTFAQQMNFSDARIDELLALGRRTADPGRRAEIYRDVEARVLDLLPWTYTIRREQGEAMRDYVHGYVHPPKGTWTHVSLRGAWLAKR